LDCAKKDQMEIQRENFVGLGELSVGYWQSLGPEIWQNNKPLSADLEFLPHPPSSPPLDSSLCAPLYESAPCEQI